MIHGNGSSDSRPEVSESNPCADALEDLWRDVLLARDPKYGDWEYPGMAYRHLLAEFYDLRQALHDAITRPAGVVPTSAEKFYDPELAEAATRARLRADGFDVSPYRGASQVQWRYPVLSAEEAAAEERRREAAS